MNDTERRRFLRTALAGAGLTLAGTAAGQETTTESEETTTDGGETTTAAGGEDEGLVTVESDQEFEATVERISSAIEDNENLTLVATVDHARNADSVDMDLRPTTLFVFGNPNLGTNLMRASQTAGIDLPQKLLVWKAEDGSVHVTYNDPAWIADRHDVEGQEEVLDKISGALEALATGQS